MSSIKLNFEGREVEIRQTKDGLYSLTDLWRASGKDDNYKPAQFTRNGKVQKCTLRTVRGGRAPGTYSDEKTVYKYAAWIDDDFYDAVFETFKHAVHGDGHKAVLTAQQVARRDGKVARRHSTDAIKEWLGEEKNSKVYMIVTKTANDLLGLKSGQRDELTAEQLMHVACTDRIIATIFRDNPESELKDLLPLIRHKFEVYLQMVGGLNLFENNS